MPNQCLGGISYGIVFLAYPERVVGDLEDCALVVHLVGFWERENSEVNPRSGEARPPGWKKPGQEGAQANPEAERAKGE